MSNDDCMITKQTELIGIDKGKHSEITGVDRTLKIETKQPGEGQVGVFGYTWNEAKGVVTTEQLAYLQFGADIFQVTNGKGPIGGVVKYNVLVKATSKYPDDVILAMMNSIEASNKYKTCGYSGGFPAGM